MLKISTNFANFFHREHIFDTTLTFFAIEKFASICVDKMSTGEWVVGGLRP